MIRYWLALLVRSQRFFPPLLLDVVGVVVLNANGTGPLTGAYGSCCAVLFPSAIWLTVGLIGLEEPPQRAITVVNAGRSGQVLAGAVVVAGLAVLAAVAFGLVFPLLLGHYTVSTAAVLVGAMGQFGAGLTGIAVGLLCSRPIIRRTAAALAVAVVLAIAAFVLPWLTPLNELLTELSGDRPAASQLGPVAGLSLLGVALVIAVGLGVHQIAIRRES